MPRQTDQTSFFFPDGFQMKVDGTDVGILEGGGTITVNWDIQQIDAGNYKNLVKRARNFSIAVAPSALLNWDLDVLKKVFSGLFVADGTGGVKMSGANTTLVGKTITLEHFAGAGNTNKDWGFTVDNCTIDAGASFNLKGQQEDGLNSINVSFTGEVDEQTGNALLKLNIPA